MTMEERVKKIEEDNAKFAKQVMLQQFFSQELARSKGDSGLLGVRLTQVGTKNYFETAHFQRGYIAIHEHSNYDRTMGLGEMSVMMNGVQFRTRHNDYKLRQAHTSSKVYRAMENIPFPSVPKSVTNKATVDEQIQEMREYFKAFKTSNTTHRDYSKFFTPVVCYLEGAWTKTNQKGHLEEPFQSDRHHIDASSWFDLMEKSQFTSYTGSKSILENYAYLPTMIYEVKDGVPLYAQWNYRILCHPIKTELPLSAFVPVEDLVGRIPTGRTLEQKTRSRRGRFIIRESGYDHFTGPDSLLDKIMNEIPGADNYQVKLHDRGLGMKYLKPGSNEELNTGYYHRYFKVKNSDGKTEKTSLRGFNDANLWVAQTTQEKVIGKQVDNCSSADSPDTCSKISIGYTYALPLEVVYMTPLMSWNPYDLREQEPTTKKKHRKRGKLYDVTAGGTRYGQANVTKALLGVASKYFYKTPQKFYTGKADNRDKADTSKFGAGVLDKNGEMHLMASAGSRIITSEIPGVGKVRLRYPIMPLHGEGSGAWKELNALREVVMKQKKYSHLYNDPPCQCTKEDLAKEGKVPVQIDLSMSSVGSGDEHKHTFWLAPEQYKDIVNKKTIRVISSVFEDHSHDLQISTDSQGRPVILKCDGESKCLDGHSNVLIKKS